MMKHCRYREIAFYLTSTSRDSFAGRQRIFFAIKFNFATPTTLDLLHNLPKSQNYKFQQSN